MTSLGFVISCYNHAEYVAGSIESALEQTRAPDRVVVVDDGSGDGSQDVIRPYSARGVHLIETERLGPSGAFNEGIAALDTDFVAILAGDDLALPWRLERQVELLLSHGVRLVMGLPEVMDQDGNLRSDDLCPEFFVPFRAPERDLLRQLFWGGNFLCASTATFHRSAFEAIGGFHPGLLQLQDFELWVRWLGQGPIGMFSERFVRYRKTATSLSSASQDRRMHSERAWVYRHFFDSISTDLVTESFRDDLDDLGIGEIVDREVVLMLLYLRHPDPLIYQVGCEMALDLASTPHGISRLADSGLRVADVYAIVGSSDVTYARERDRLIDDMLAARRSIVRSDVS